MENHPKLRPVRQTRRRLYLRCGTRAQDIPESVAQASAAASKVQITLAAAELTREPEIATINEKTCAGCFRCVVTCPYHAIERPRSRRRRGPSSSARRA